MRHISRTSMADILNQPQYSSVEKIKKKKNTTSCNKTDPRAARLAGARGLLTDSYGHRISFKRHNNTQDTTTEIHGAP